jgi:hypothetical protein
VPADIRGSPPASLAFGLPLAALVATPVAAHCWVMGFSGNQWFLANLSACAALLLFQRAPAGAPWFALLPAFLATIPGAFAHSTHLAIWPALLLAALLAPAPRAAAAFCLGAATVFFALFRWGFGGELGHPAPGAGFGEHLDFVATYLGLHGSGGFGEDRHWGGAGILLFALALGIVARRPRPSRRALVPWLALAGYAAFQAVGSAIARSGLGVDAARVSRYASLPALFWTGTLATLAIAAWDLRPGRIRRLSLAAIGSVALLLLVSSTTAGLQLLRHQLRRVEQQPLAALAMRWNIADYEAIRSLTPAPANVQVSRSFFVRTRHIPFDRAADWQLGAAVARPPAVGERVRGKWLTAAARPGGFLAVTGKAQAAADDARRVLFLDREGVLRGAAVFVPRRQDGLPSLLRRRRSVETWSGYLDAEWAPRVTPHLETEEAGSARLVRLSTPHAGRRALLPELTAPARSEEPPSGTPEDLD